MIASQKIKLFLVDDHQMMMDGIISLLRGEKQFEIAGTALNGNDALKKLATVEPAILIADVSMEGMSGIELAKEVKKLYPAIKILILTMFNEKSVAREIIDAGADGYIIKNCGKDELLEALNTLRCGKKYFSSLVINTMIDAMKMTEPKKTGKDILTNREQEILRLVAGELSTSEIAAKLFISERTVETHRKNLLRKTGAKNIVGLVKYAYECKLVD